MLSRIKIKILINKLELDTNKKFFNVILITALYQKNKLGVF